jgi:general stress protein YciG
MSTREGTTENAPETNATTTTENAEASAAPARKKLRGFAAMDPAAVRAIARKGGVAAHERGTAHRFTAEEAQHAGRKGGLAPHKTRGGPSRRRASAAPSTSPSIAPSSTATGTGA